VLPAAAVGTAAGVLMGVSSKGSVFVLGAAGALILFAVPIEAVVVAGLVGSVLFRMVAPSASGALSYVPDALLATAVVRVAASAVLGRAERVPHTLRWLPLLLVVFIALLAASAIASGDGGRIVVSSLRQYLRYPLWALTLLRIPADRRTARLLLWTLLGLSLVQLPLAFRQHVGGSVVPAGLHLQPADLITGSFGIGGSGVMTIFLVMAATLWVALAVERVIPAWWLAGLAPVLVLPMAMGSAAVFVILLPLAVMLVLARAAFARGRRPGLPVLIGGLIFISIAVWTGGRIAVAPGLGSGQVAATDVLSAQYLRQYVGDSSQAGPASRLGFLRYAVRTDLASRSGALLGTGPASSVIAGVDVRRADTGLGSFLDQVRSSVWSLQRVLLAFGFPATAVFVLLLGMPGILLRGPLPRDRVLRAAVLSLPVIAFLYVITGPYSAPWTDPGVSVAYWSVVLVSSMAIRCDAADRAGRRASCDVVEVPE
jgi:hypothetical protein